MGAALKATGLAPDHLTAFGLVLAVPAAWAIATGSLGLGLALVIASALPDLLDGALAKASGRASVRGAFFDSVADRVTDALFLGALAWYLHDTHPGNIFMLPVAVLAVSMLVSYERAKAESLGFTAKGGLMERAERIVVLCATLAFSVVMIPLLWFMLAMTAVTAVQRFVMVWRQATRAGQGPPPAEKREARYSRTDRRSGYETVPVAVRWRAWREANGWTPRAERYSGRARPTSAAARWHERRLARQARVSRDTEADSISPGSPGRRRSSSRRP